MTGHRPTDYRIKSFALELLRAGVLASDLPNRLMEEFGISSARASELAEEMLKLHMKPPRRGRLDTKKLKPGN
jgi:hypothetical protein